MFTSKTSEPGSETHPPQNPPGFKVSGEVEEHRSDPAGHQRWTGFMSRPCSSVRLRWSQFRTEVLTCTSAVSSWSETKQQLGTARYPTMHFTSSNGGKLTLPGTHFGHQVGTCAFFTMREPTIACR